MAFNVSAFSIDGLRVEFDGGAGNDGKWDYFRRVAGAYAPASFVENALPRRTISSAGQRSVEGVVCECVVPDGGIGGEWRPRVLVQACAGCTPVAVAGDGEYVGSVGKPGEVFPDRVPDSCAAEGSVCVGESTVGGSLVADRTEKNRAKRRRKVIAKRRKREQATAGCVPDTQAFVPEWRRKDPKAAVHKGVFSDCSLAMQEQLRESRAKMLVAKNAAAAVRAEHDKRLLEAKMKSCYIEEDVDCQRLESKKKYERLTAEYYASRPAGYAETLLSCGVSVPSLTSNSVSPSSSASMAEFKRMQDALKAVLARVAELEGELAGRSSGVTKRSTPVVASPVVVQAKKTFVKKAKCYTIGECEDSAAEALRSTSVEAVGDVDASVEAIAARLEADSYENSGATFDVMPKEEYDYRRLVGLPVVGPGSGLKGYGRWD